jgi:thiamine-monophosphate kinase
MIGGMAGDELALVDWLSERGRRHAAVPLGIGDDMAIVASEGAFLISSVMLLDGVHFDAVSQPLAAIGRKAIACGLSDCAAMAVQPVAATVSLGLPRTMALADVQDLYEGMFAIADEFDMPIVGGDTTRWGSDTGRLTIDVAVTGSPWPGIVPVRRSGARPGDRLYVTGPLGGSLLGRHLRFTPRIQEARTLAAAFGSRLHALLDISDGLSLDAWRMCQASRVGARLTEAELERVISADAVHAALQSGRSSIDHLMSDGEDFELLLALDGEPGDPPSALHPVGHITSKGFDLVMKDGSLMPLTPKGYVH